MEIMDLQLKLEKKDGALYLRTKLKRRDLEPLVEMAKSTLRDVGNIAGELLLAELGLTNLDLELIGGTGVLAILKD